MEYTIKNENGMQATFINYACTLKNLLVPDNKGNLVDVVLGYDDEDTYETGSASLGAFVGRYANRIGGSGFVLDGRTFSLPANEGKNHLHGTFNHRAFDGEIKDGKVIFTGVSEDGEDGFPGRVEFTVTFFLTKYNELVITYRATTDAPTVINLTNHSYFNLNGQDHTNILDHRFSMTARKYLELNPESIPTGNILDVKGTKFDYNLTRYIDGDLDHCYVLNNNGELAYVCTLASQKTGIVLQCFTTEPGVQVYTANHIQEDRARTGKGRRKYPKYGAVCLETQHYPDSPNHPDFPSTVLRPGETFRSKTVYKFLIR